MKDYDAEVLRWLAMRRWSATWLTSELCTAASYDRGGTAASALLAAGAEPNSVSREYPALMWAMLAGNAAVMRALCAAGADVHARYEGDGGHGGVFCIATALSDTPPFAPERDYVASLRALADAGRDITRCVAQGRAIGTLRAAAMCAAEPARPVAPARRWRGRERPERSVSHHAVVCGGGNAGPAPRARRTRRR